MKAKKRKMLKAKMERIAAGRNNGWLNFALAIDCKDCKDPEKGTYCKYREGYLDAEKTCVKKNCEAKKNAKP